MERTTETAGLLDPRQETVNTQILARLANNEVNQRVEDYGALPVDIKQSLERQMAEQRQDVVDSAASEIVKLLANKDKFLVGNQLSISNLQSQIDNLVSLQKSVQRATQYGLSTQNFLPLLKVIGGSMPHGVDKKATEVPKDWTAPVATPAT